MKAPRMESIIERRARLLGSRMPQYYETPFQPVRGEGVWLHDVHGKVFLDAYNNVPHVGHCHPHVVEAICRQTRLLNTNTRYLFDSILDYADRLTRTMPPELNACAFTCTGSEANDLAWRMASCFSKAGGAITTRHAYHGNTTFLDSIDGSSVKTARPPAPWWATIPAPESLPYAGAHAQRAIERLRDNGYAPAALFIDSTFASDGLIIPEPGCLDSAVEAVRKAGGLIIADEVQAGLGRLGSDLWSWQRLGLFPDIVTLGKPMANGQPLGVVVTRREILEVFQAEDRYFNTFAGNPVACSAGLAVLDVMEEEKLQENAARAGRILVHSIEELAGKHEYIKSIRGTGFLMGVEISKHGCRDAPGPAEARWLLNEMYRRGVLVGSTGRRGGAMNTLKIRPPMVFDTSHVDHFMSVMSDALTALAEVGGTITS